MYAFRVEEIVFAFQYNINLTAWKICDKILPFKVKTEVIHLNKIFVFGLF